MARARAQRLPPSPHITMAVAAALLVALSAIASAGAGATADCTNKDEATLAHWSLDGTLDDVSHNQRGPVIGAWDRAPVGGNIKLTWPRASAAACAGFVSIGSPGYLEVPHVDFHNISFTFSFTIRLKFDGEAGAQERKVLFSNWNAPSPQRSFEAWLAADRKVWLWFRNKADTIFVEASTSSAVPFGEWTDVAVTWDRSARTAAIYINGEKKGGKTVAAAENDINMPLPDSYFYQFGASALGAYTNYAPLYADLRDLRVFKGVVVPSKPSAAESQPLLPMAELLVS